MKYKCFQSECPICHQPGSIQLFINNKQEATCSRTRHTTQNKDSRKQQFTYCKINNLETLKTLLSKQNISVTETSTTLGQTGQQHGFEFLDPQLRGCATKQQNKQWRVT